MNDFLPKEYRGIPTESKYMRLVEGENRFRILASAIVGTEYWVEDSEGNRKPKRVKVGQTVPMGEVSNNKYGKPAINHFWMFPVWNYQDEKVQLLELTQKTIMGAIRDLTLNPKWGDPKEYDIVVTRSKDKSGKTVYSTLPDPKEELASFIKSKYKETYINLEAIWEGKDPFSKNEDISPDEVHI